MARAEIRGTIIAETPRSLFVSAVALSGNEERMYLPRSQILYMRRSGKNFLAEVPVWLAMEKKLDYEEKE